MDTQNKSMKSISKCLNHGMQLLTKGKESGLTYLKNIVHKYEKEKTIPQIISFLSENLLEEIKKRKSDPLTFKILSFLDHTQSLLPNYINTNQRAQLIENFGDFYFKNHQYDRAQVFYIRSLDIMEAHNLSISKPAVLNKLTRLFLKLKRQLIYFRFTQALEINQLSIQSSQLMVDQQNLYHVQELILAYQLKGDVYDKMDRPVESKSAYVLSSQIAKKYLKDDVNQLVNNQMALKLIESKPMSKLLERPPHNFSNSHMYQEATKKLDKSKQKIKPKLQDFEMKFKPYIEKQQTPQKQTVTPLISKFQNNRQKSQTQIIQNLQTSPKKLIYLYPETNKMRKSNSPKQKKLRKNFNSDDYSPFRRQMKLSDNFMTKLQSECQSATLIPKKKKDYSKNIRQEKLSYQGSEKFSDSYSKILLKLDTTEGLQSDIPKLQKTNQYSVQETSKEFELQSQDMEIEDQQPLTQDLQVEEMDQFQKCDTELQKNEQISMILNQNVENSQDSKIEIHFRQDSQIRSSDIQQVFQNESFSQDNMNNTSYDQQDNFSSEYLKGSQSTLKKKKLYKLDLDQKIQLKNMKIFQDTQTNKTTLTIMVPEEYDLFENQVLKDNLSLFTEKQLAAARKIYQFYKDRKKLNRFRQKPFHIELEKTQIDVFSKVISLKKQIGDNQLQVKGLIKIIYFIQSQKIVFQFHRRFTLTFYIDKLELNNEKKIRQFCQDLYYNTISFIYLKKDLRLEIQPEIQGNYLIKDQFSNSILQIDQLNFVEFNISFRQKKTQEVIQKKVYQPMSSVNEVYSSQVSSEKKVSKKHEKQFSENSDDQNQDKNIKFADMDSEKIKSNDQIVQQVQSSKIELKKTQSYELVDEQDHQIQKQITSPNIQESPKEDILAQNCEKEKNLNVQDDQFDLTLSFLVLEDHQQLQTQQSLENSLQEIQIKKNENEFQKDFLQQENLEKEEKKETQEQEEIQENENKLQQEDFLNSEILKDSVWKISDPKIQSNDEVTSEQIDETIYQILTKLMEEVFQQIDVKEQQNSFQPLSIYSCDMVSSQEIIKDTLYKDKKQIIEEQSQVEDEQPIIEQYPYIEEDKSQDNNPQNQDDKSQNIKNDIGEQIEEKEQTLVDEQMEEEKYDDENLDKLDESQMTHNQDLENSRFKGRNANRSLTHQEFFSSNLRYSFFQDESSVEHTKRDKNQTDETKKVEFPKISQFPEVKVKEKVYEESPVKRKNNRLYTVTMKLLKPLPLEGQDNENYNFIKNIKGNMVAINYTQIAQKSRMQRYQILMPSFLEKIIKIYQKKRSFSKFEYSSFFFDQFMSYVEQKSEYEMLQCGLIQIYQETKINDFDIQFSYCVHSQSFSIISDFIEVSPQIIPFKSNSVQDIYQQLKYLQKKMQYCEYRNQRVVFVVDFQKQQQINDAVRVIQKNKYPFIKIFKNFQVHICRQLNNNKPLSILLKFDSHFTEPTKMSMDVKFVTRMLKLNGNLSDMARFFSQFVDENNNDLLPVPEEIEVLRKYYKFFQISSDKNTYETDEFILVYASGMYNIKEHSFYILCNNQKVYEQKGLIYMKADKILNIIREHILSLFFVQDKKQIFVFKTDQNVVQDEYFAHEYLFMGLKVEVECVRVQKLLLVQLTTFFNRDQYTNISYVTNINYLQYFREFQVSSLKYNPSIQAVELKEEFQKKIVVEGIVENLSNFLKESDCFILLETNFEKITHNTLKLLQITSKRKKLFKNSFLIEKIFPVQSQVSVKEDNQMNEDSETSDLM